MEISIWKSQKARVSTRMDYVDLTVCYHDILFDYCEWWSFRVFYSNRVILYPCISFLFAWKCLRKHCVPNYLRRKVELTSKSHIEQINCHVFSLPMIASFSVAPTLSRAKNLWASLITYVINQDNSSTSRNRHSLLKKCKFVWSTCSVLCF